MAPGYWSKNPPPWWFWILAFLGMALASLTGVGLLLAFVYFLQG